jgi:hypothetical protein
MIVAGFLMMSMFERDKTSSQPIVWTTTLFMAAFYIGAIAALFFVHMESISIADKEIYSPAAICLLHCG